MLAGVLASALFLTSCGNYNSYQSKYDDYQEKLESIKAAQSADDDSTTAKTTGKTTAQTTTKTDVEVDPTKISSYEIKSIGPFINGVAEVTLMALAPNSTWRYDYFHNFVDTKGNLLLPMSYGDGQSVWNGAAKMTTQYGYVDQIVTTNGKVLVTENDANVVDIGEVSQGFYWVLTVDETLAGNIYTTTYYNTEGKKQFAFENTLPGVNNSSDNEDGTFSKYGYAMIHINGAGKIIDTKGNIVYEAKKKDGTPTMMNWLYIDKCIAYIKGNYGIWGETDLGLYEETEKTIGFDPETHSEFKSAATIEWEVSEPYNNQPRLVTLYLSSSDNVIFWAIADENGNVKMKPQRDISISLGDYFEQYTFSEGLCIAEDVSTGLYGYINENGEWVIKPQYKKAESFSEGYATVVDSNENCKVINKKGEVVLQGKS